MIEETLLGPDPTRTATVLLLVLARGFRNQRSLTRPHGVLLLMLFVAYYVYLFSQQQG